MPYRMDRLFSAGRKLVLPSIGFLCLLLSCNLAAQTRPAGTSGTGKSGHDYVSAAVTFNEFRSIVLALDGTQPGVGIVDTLPGEKAHTYGLMLSYGTFINDYFKTEWRYGTGIKDDTIEGTLDVNLTYWLAWYFGFQHPITEQISGYAMYGMSYFEADETRREIEYLVPGGNLQLPRIEPVVPSYERLQEGLFGTNFSTTWMLGLEFSLVKDWYLAVEYGRLLKDTDSNIKVRQLGTHLRYEF